MKRARPFVGMAIMFGAVTCFGIKDGLAKMMAGDFLPNELLWGQFVVSLLAVLPFVLRQGGWAAMRPRPFLGQVARSGFLLFAVFCIYWAVRHIPLADATAMYFLAPLVVTAFSPLVLNERVGPRRWAAVVVGFAGVLVILRPEFGGARAAYFIGMMAGLSIGFFYMSNRRLSGYSNGLVAFAWAMLIGVVVLTPVVPIGWRTPELHNLPLLVPFLVLSSAGTLMMIWAFSFAPASVLAPFQYAQLVAATAFGFIVFGNLPDGWTWIGTVLVVGAGLYLAVHEQRRGRAAAAAERDVRKPPSAASAGAPRP